MSGASSDITPEHDPRSAEQPPHEPSTLDKQLALRSAAERLASEFRGEHDRDTIEAYLLSSYDELARQARLVNFVPLLAERFARQRLHALARLEAQHADGRPVVLFLCTHNAGRSQMALGFFRHLAGDTGLRRRVHCAPRETLRGLAGRRPGRHRPGGGSRNT